MQEQVNQPGSSTNPAATLSGRPGIGWQPETSPDPPSATKGYRLPFHQFTEGSEDLKRCFFRAVNAALEYRAKGAAGTIALHAKQVFCGCWRCRRCGPKLKRRWFRHIATKALDSRGILSVLHIRATSWAKLYPHLEDYVRIDHEVEGPNGAKIPYYYVITPSEVPRKFQATETRYDVSGTYDDDRETFLIALADILRELPFTNGRGRISTSSSWRLGISKKKKENKFSVALGVSHNTVQQIDQYMTVVVGAKKRLAGSGGKDRFYTDIPDEWLANESCLGSMLIHMGVRTQHYYGPKKLLEILESLDT